MQMKSLMKWKKLDIEHTNVSFWGEKAQLKLRDKCKNNLDTFLSFKYNQFPTETQKTIGNDIMHIENLENESI